jgi:hypothetical protein
LCALVTGAATGAWLAEALATPLQVEQYLTLAWRWKKRTARASDR